MSNAYMYYFACALLSIGVLAGIFMMSKVKTAVLGNKIGAVSIALAILLALSQNGILGDWLLWAGMAAGAAVGLYGAYKVKMIEMPQGVALLNGIGGLASAIVAVVTLTENQAMDTFTLATAYIALIVGMLTFSGSMVAVGKLHKILAQRPVVWKNHQLITTATLCAIGVCFVVALFEPVHAWRLLPVLSVFFGIAFAIRVGGADMPITIALLNSLTGVACSAAGMAIEDILLVAVGGIVGASGLILTQIMCKAMNRSLPDIMLGKTSAPAPAAKPPVAKSPEKPMPAEIEKQENPLASAKKVIIVPGYGMALAQAQSLVKQLADKLTAKGAEVKYAIHPVAGRMPGHMNVLLCEVDIPYEELYEMDTINPEFADCDVAIVVGANDVVNPAANIAEGTPIYGMPILDVEKAKHIIICNYDTKPGYAGVDNPIYTKKSGVTLMLGDAQETLRSLITEVESGGKPQAQEKMPAADGLETALASAKKVIIVPGYGMALAQAQSLVKQLADKLTAKGAEVKYAIHPVAGRMPGHMNVLLCEVDIPYEELYEMDTINPEFADCDVAIVVGANDVVNPAANIAEGTPIYGMPILDVEKAKHIIICNYDTKPGYAGVDNPIYTKKSGVTLMLGDAQETLRSLITEVESGGKPKAQEKMPAADGLETTLASAKKVIIVPGYGMALAQAQSLVKQLADKLTAKGAEVKYAIHPVAGRMPGHMNVLLCEVDIPYEELYEMDIINPEFAGCDIAIVVGANDVVNPAANIAEGTPIYGMPILDVEKAKHIIICNYDTKPGYAGVDNPIYTRESGVTLMLGDAQETLQALINKI